MTPIVTSAGGTTTISAAVRPNTPQVELSYDENTSPPTTRTVTFRARVRPQHLDTKTFVIEVEDFDYDGGSTNPQKGTAGMDVDVMPYDGGAYDGLSAVLGVDFDNNDGDDSVVYRSGLNGGGRNVDITDNMGGQWGQERPGYMVTANYRIGWVDGGDWQNYTRNIPAGTYNAYAALSFDGTSAGQLHAVLGQVTSGVGTANQTVKTLGVWDAAGSGGWGRSDLVPLKAPDGSALPLKLGGKTTLRITLGSGDYDYLLLAPDKTSRASVVWANPTGNSTQFYSRNDVTVVIQDFSTACVTSSVKLTVDGADVTANATVTKAGDLTTVKYNGTPGVHTYVVSFADDGSPSQNSSFSASWKAGPLPAAGTFAIEAEDFNYDGGKSVAAASVMPYVGNAYNGLGAISGVDYNKDDDNSSDVYRTEKDGGGQNAVNINENLGGRWGADRGTYSVTTNYKIGWIGGGQWFNLTRDIPTGTYEVWAALSFDGTDASQLSGGLARVTSDPSQANQTTVDLGVFDARGTHDAGGWGANDLVPLTDTPGGNRVVIDAGPNTTLRMNSGSGDFDWFVLVPAAKPPPKDPKITAVRLNGDGTVTVEWVNGTLQAAPTVLGPWQDVTGATSPLTLSPTGKMQFGRVRQ
ncbi:MAG: hypothetical protein HY260_17025 [Chloroflexi bacterium]|nr:hypothetical protein [Chloroflexota bacterium]